MLPGMTASTQRHHQTAVEILRRRRIAARPMMQVNRPPTAEHAAPIGGHAARPDR